MSKLIQFVRGELDWKKLEGLGVQIAFSKAGQVTVKGRARRVVSPSVRDLACGFLNYRHDQKRLREWASIMLAVGEIDLAALDHDKAGEVFLEALWDAAHGDEVENVTFTLAEERCEGLS